MCEFEPSNLPVDCNFETASDFSSGSLSCTNSHLESPQASLDFPSKDLQRRVSRISAESSQPLEANFPLDPEAAPGFSSGNLSCVDSHLKPTLRSSHFTNQYLLSRLSRVSTIPPGPLETRELRKFTYFIGCGAYKTDDPSSYKQILPKATFTRATEVFQRLEPDQRSAFIRMLDEFYRDNETNLFAISTLFAVLAYGKDFAKKFIEFASAEGNGLKASLSRSQEYLSVQQNFSQNYLNTCTAVSAFAVLSDAFCGNVEVLKFALEYEVSKLEKEVPNGTDPAFKSHSWRDAPTVNEERIRRIELCKSTLDAIENGTPPKTIEEQRNELLHVMEMVSALQDDTPTLLSTRVLNGISKRLCGKCEFIISCALSIVGNFLAKIVSFGAYVGSLNFKERFAGVRPPKINFLSFVGNSKHVIDFESRNLPGLWAEIFPCGTTVEWRSNNHCIAVKAAKDEHGKYLVVYDPIQGTSEIIRVP